MLFTCRMAQRTVTLVFTWFNPAVSPLTLLYRLYSGLWVVCPASTLALRHLICRVCCAWFGPRANAGKTTIGCLAARGFGERPSRKNETGYHHLKPPRQKKSRRVRIMSWRRRWGEGSEHTRAPPPADRACGLRYLTFLHWAQSSFHDIRVVVD